MFAQILVILVEFSSVAEFPADRGEPVTVLNIMFWATSRFLRFVFFFFPDGCGDMISPRITGAGGFRSIRLIRFVRTDLVFRQYRRYYRFVFGYDSRTDSARHWLHGHRDSRVYSWAGPSGRSIASTGTREERETASVHR